MTSSSDRPPVTFWDYCNDNPDLPAIVEVGGTTWSRGEIGASSVRMRNQLASRGISERDAVAVVAPNCAEFMIAYLGITMLGATAVPINYHLTGEEILYILRTSGARVVLVHAWLREKIDLILALAGSPRPHLLPIDAGMTPMERGRQSPGLESGVPMPRDLGRAMLFTSATTGKPKAVRYRDASGYGGLKKRIAFREVHGTRRDSGTVHFCASMLYHVGPLEGAVVTLHMGNTVLLMRTWELRTALRAMSEYRVTEAFLVPIMMVQLAKIPESERDQYDLTSLRMLIHAGAPCPAEAKRKVIDWLGPIVYEGYGASEGGGTFVSSSEWLKYPGTVGRAIPGSEVTIRGPRGEVLPPGKEGYIYMRAYTGDRFEYVGDPDGTSKCYVGDQFTVGDIGYLNEEGYLFILDRAVNMILCGGANIYPAEVEAVLSSHAGVADCAVLGRPDEMFGETVHALVQISPDWKLPESRLRAELVRLARARLAPSKLPRTIDFVKEVPRDPNGKLMKRRISRSRTTD